MLASLYRSPAATPFGSDLVDLLQVGRRELHLQRPQVLLQVLPPLGPEEGHDVFALGEHPGERELRRAAPLPFRDRLHLLDQLEVLPEVVALESGSVPSVVVDREVVDRTEATGEQAAAERAVGDEADAQLAAHGEDLVLRVAVPERVLGLERGDRCSRCARRMVAGAASERPR